MKSRAILFVTDELFLPLPPKNASGWLYYTIARTYKQRGWKVYCVSFFRDRTAAESKEVVAAYQGLFSDFLLLPGWNRGGHLLGVIGLIWRELRRAVTGDVFSSHPFLFTNIPKNSDKIRERFRDWQVDVVYFAKPHSIQLLGMAVPSLSDCSKPLLVLSIHDDFVSRAIAYRSVYQRLFDTLSLPETLHKHANAWIRYHIERIDKTRSRRTEAKILSACHLVRIESEDEFANYSVINGSTAKLSHKPFSYAAPVKQLADELTEQFDAGFLGSNDVMNLDAVLYLREEILPLIRKEAPNFRMLIAGGISSKIEPIIRGVGNVTVWKKLEDVSDFYRAVRISAVPLRAGTGVSIKVLEALSFNKPIVSTAIGVRGIPRKMLTNAVVTSNPEEFARALLTDRDRSNCHPNVLAADG
jgi:hypothetical protein